MRMMDKLNNLVRNHVAANTVETLRAQMCKEDLLDNMDPERALKLHGYASLTEMQKAIRRYAP